MEMNKENTTVTDYGNYKIYESEFDIGAMKGLIKVILPAGIPVNKIDIAITGGTAIEKMQDSDNRRT